MTARVAIAFAGLLSLSACAASGDEEAEPDRGGAGGKADGTGSCEGACGGQSASGDCWCDDGCAGFGDCCDDIAAECTMASACGSGTVEGNTLAWGKKLAIADDGTIYHAHFDAGTTFLARTRPGAEKEWDWLDIGASVRSLVVAPDGVVVALIARDEAAEIVRIDPSASPAAAVALGAPFAAAAPAPTDLAMSPAGELFVGGFFGVARVTASGQRQPIETTLQVSDLLHTGTELIAIAHGPGIVRIAANGSVSTIFPFETRAFQRIGIDDLGRYYVTEDSHVTGVRLERLLRYDPSFAQEETLFSRPGSQSSDFGDIAFGRGALACDVYIAGWDQGHRVTVGTPGRP